MGCVRNFPTGAVSADEGLEYSLHGTVGIGVVLNF